MVFKRRWKYFWLIITIIPLGILTRRTYISNILYCESVNNFWCFMGKYIPDAFYAIMVYWGLRLLFYNQKLVVAFTGALFFCFGIELLQFYDAPWIEAVRENKLGGLILGYSFLWSDLVCYSVGILTSYILDRYFIK